MAASSASTYANVHVCANLKEVVKDVALDTEGTDWEQYTHVCELDKGGKHNFAERDLRPEGKFWRDETGYCQR